MKLVKENIRDVFKPKDIKHLVRAIFNDFIINSILGQTLKAKQTVEEVKIGRKGEQNFLHSKFIFFCINKRLSFSIVTT